MSALDDFVKQSATSYLQSVVFVDDNIYESQGGKPLELSQVDPDLGSGLKPQFVGPEEEGGEGESLGTVISTKAEDAETLKMTSAVEAGVPEATGIDRTAQYHPRELMESFAQRGIVCALYEPRKGFRVGADSEIFRLCDRADIVILDWDLFNDDGDAVSELLAELIKKSQEEHPHHVRLCALYTDKPSLQPVMSRLLVKLEGRHCSVMVDPDGKLRLMAGATKILVFGKPLTVGRPPEDRPYEVRESELADRVISDFADLHYGLLPALALHGLAGIRRNTKRLLDKFKTEQDGAFLLHRALILGDGDAFHELSDLLSEEIQAVLEDTWPKSETLAGVASVAIDKLPLVNLVPPWTTKQGQPCDAGPIFREILKNGAVSLDVARDKCSDFKVCEKGKGFRKISPALLNAFGKLLTLEGRYSPEHLASLFCARTQYAADGRTLRFGTVVRHKKTGTDVWEYSVCLMPICDSQRLDKAYRFPFWGLKEDFGAGLTGKRFGIVVVDAEEQAHCLSAGDKIREMLWLHEFLPGKNRTVVAAKTGNRFVFASTDMVIEWVAELKPLHAQRIAAYMGAEVSRVGLVEYEWLRLYCDR